MPPERGKATRDLDRVQHMRDSIQEALEFARGKKLNDLKKDRKLALALTKELEIIGEAASKVSAAFQGRHPEIPWGLLVATRNRLIHGYFDIDLETVWNTVARDLKPLLAAVRKILKT